MDLLHFENEPILKAAFVGSAYEADPFKLRKEFGLGEGRLSIEERKIKQNEHAATSQLPTILFAPHIDFRVEKELYIKAFQSLPSPKKYSRVLVIGTSHYAGYFPDIYENTPFIGTTKNFESPLGTIKSAADWVEQLATKSCTENLGLSFQDRAYKPEHSIEFHLILAQLFLGKDFDFFPILVGSLEDLMYTDQAEQAFQLEALAKTLNTLIFSYPKPEELLILISGDLAHIGPRFGDQYDAQSAFKNVAKFDELFLSQIAALNYDSLLALMRSNYDGFSHCGFPPALLALKMFGTNKWNNTQIIGREHWYEADDQSMVSYGAVLVTD